MRRIAVIYLAAGALALLAGCPGPNAPPGAPTFVQPRDLAQVHVVTFMPATVDLDGQPGPDGIRAQVYLESATDSVPVLVDGTLEMKVYDGHVLAANLDQAKPLGTWTFGPQELRKHVVRTSWGWGYDLVLLWTGQRPTRNVATLTVRLVTPDGRSLSAPLTNVILGAE